ncbi:unnamed protein product, partial [Mesorhabditis belari]|uniref:TOG domain-containing protein n=1 Tax=Mesorhabditis belari TaxID=2138241 RepID=A0AAF3J8M3_9BILA
MADDFDYFDSFDVIKNLPTTFYSDEGGVNSKKWQERKDALELISDNPKFDSKANYGELISTLNKLLGKDSNVNVNAVAAQCLAGIAYGLRTKFGPYASTVLPTVIEKLKEKKALLRGPVVECLDKVAFTTSLDSLQEALNTLDADHEVRSASIEALGSMLRATGPGGNALVKEIAEDKARMEKVQAALEQAKLEVAEEQAQEPIAAAQPTVNHAQAGEEQTSTAAVSALEAVDPFDFLDPFDVVSKLPSTFYDDEGGVMSKKWQDRTGALEALLKLMVENPKLNPKANYGELIGTLNKLLAKDSNINVAALAAKCLGGIAYGLRRKFGPYVLGVLPSILEKFKEKKSLLRDSLVECIDRVGATVDFETLEEGLTQGLENKNPQIKTQTDSFVERYLRKPTSQIKPEKIKGICAHLVKHTGDPDVEVREAAYNALGSIQRIIGERVLMNWCQDIATDKIKMAKVNEASQKLIHELGPHVPVAASHPSTSTASDQSSKKSVRPKSSNSSLSVVESKKQKITKENKVRESAPIVPVVKVENRKKTPAVQNGISNNITKKAPLPSPPTSAQGKPPNASRKVCSQVTSARSPRLYKEVDLTGSKMPRFRPNTA